MLRASGDTSASAKESALTTASPLVSPATAINADRDAWAVISTVVIAAIIIAAGRRPIIAVAIAPPCGAVTAISDTGHQLTAAHGGAFGTDCVVA
jgi:hypothetical protein